MELNTPKETWGNRGCVLDDPGQELPCPVLFTVFVKRAGS
jgi:hypothetical protein